MNRPRFDSLVLRSALLGPLTLFLLPACGTDEISPGQTILDLSPTDPNQGGLLIVVAPTAETAAEAAQSNDEPSYHVLVDGKELMYDDPVQPIVVTGGGAFSAGFYTGMHHFELAATNSPTVFEVDGTIASGALTRLYVFGARDALQARLVTYPFEPPAGQEHLSAINLVRAGVEIEVVSCTDATTCTPLSPPLALGDTFDTDVPSSPGGDGGNFSRADSGAGYGYRQVATAALPTPPVLSMMVGFGVGGTDPNAPPAAFIAAPIYMSADGTPLEEAP
jgi:hypothetical protein